MALLNQHKEFLLSMFATKIIGFDFEKPITFKSGLISPMYCDWRMLNSFPANMHQLAKLMAEMLRTENIPYAGIGAVPMGAIPHATALQIVIDCPGAWIRPDAKPKAHGKGKIIEGWDVRNQRVLIYEDLFTTGQSMLEAAEIYRAQGANVVDAISIFSYGLPELKTNCTAMHISSHSLFSIEDIISVLHGSDLADTLLGPGNLESLMLFAEDPQSWNSVQQV